MKRGPGFRSLLNVRVWLVAMLFLGLACGEYGLGTCAREAGCCEGERPVPQPAKPAPAPAAQKPAPPAPKPTANCKLLLEDAAFLREQYAKVRSPRYRATKKSCDEVMKVVNGRIGVDWHRSRGVTPAASAGEPRVTDAARTMGVSCSGIVLHFACDSPAKLKAEYGPEVVAGYDRDFQQFVADLETACR